MQLGTFPVAFFFILSGFVLSMGYGDRINSADFNYKKFIRKRYFKLFPFNLICLPLAILVYNNTDYLLFDVFLVQSWIPDELINYSGNDVAWFLSDMILLYLLFPLLYKWLSNKTIAKTAITLICYFVTIQFVPSHLVHTYIYTCPWFRIVDFMLGITLWSLIREYIHKRECKFSPRMTFFLEVSSIFIVVLFLAIYKIFPLRYGLTSLYWIPSLYLIGSLTIVHYNGGGGIFRLLDNKYLVKLGAISFYFYLIHKIVIRYFKHNKEFLASIEVINSHGIVASLICLLIILFSVYAYSSFIEPKISKIIKT